ncbi:hydrogenase maturation nickel metallochaperone HypA/HybF [Chitinophaga nivalis]|uniref:Hydrogenase maturation nickel metallochaperone HypA n=1 Tax=Chitinophaga nivalis TaxID=2991709 RepID=A0ABT3IEV2_9BACT|nr:hydrogenase maturation nickel metallochaperone HypA [Chitinophaga nivalis]MCW3467819.1 hydrogenase maturation nickel metallochaperone HypA [Chitinophaga nivalis]MCW3482489.1 hydrogenase maturation nickel metallochaperone HypA [Chitinophaga nivalis]
MHEVPIIREMVKMLQEQYPDKFSQIIKVTVEAGLLSNVQPVLIQNAFEALVLENDFLKDIDLEVVTLPIIAHCDACDKNFTVTKHRFICGCGKPAREIVQGKELRISRVDFLNE